MFQISKSFDPVTVVKIKRSALIGFGGFIIAAIPTLLSDKIIMGFLSTHPLVSLFVGSFVPVILNGVRQWLAGQPQQ